LQEKSKNNFGIAFFITSGLIFIVGIFILYLGKRESFLLINGQHNAYFDVFFKYYTLTGDGWMWAIIAVFCFFLKRKYLIAVISGIFISTFLAQFLKRVVFPEELRPITFLAENFPVHIVEGVTMRRMNSFPSGHSAAAFTMALIMAHMINKKTWSIILPFLALLAGYSRVYLAQHFLTDVWVGMCIGILSAIFSLLIYRSFIRYLSRKVKIISNTDT